MREADFTLLLECGSGVFAKLRDVHDYRFVDAVLISHLHADHFLDLVPYSYALLYSPRPREVAGGEGQVPARRVRPALHVPPGAGGAFRRLVGSWGPEDLIESAFACREYDEQAALELGPLRARFCEVPHYTRSFAIELQTPTGRRLTFGADCAPNEQLVEFARDTDLLLVEATLEQPEQAGRRGHMTAREAGELARRARARRVVLTHFTDELGDDWVSGQGSAGYGGAVALAHAGAEFTV